jgi:hypothetical protein
MTIRMLIAKLHLETISRQDTIRQVKDALSSLSPDLNVMYGQNVDRIPEKDRKLAFNVFAWVAHAPQPLNMNQLCQAIAIDPYDEAISDVTEDDLPHPAKILQACVGLVKTWDYGLDKRVWNIILVRA